MTWFRELWLQWLLHRYFYLEAQRRDYLARLEGYSDPVVTTIEYGRIQHKVEKLDFKLWRLCRFKLRKVAPFGRWFYFAGRKYKVLNDKVVIG